MSDSWRLGYNPDFGYRRRETCQNEDQSKVSQEIQTLFVIAPTSNRVCLTQCAQGAHMDPMWLQVDVGEILGSRATEIGALGTPGLSHGIKFLVSWNFW